MVKQDVIITLLVIFFLQNICIRNDVDIYFQSLMA